MNQRSMRSALAATLLLAATLERSAGAQAPAADSTAQKVKKAAFWDDQSILNFTLTADFGRFRKDARSRDSVPYRAAKITYLADGKEVAVPLRIKPRGIRRRKSCYMAPIRLNFNKDSTKNTVFAKQNRVKLVVSCKNADDYEQYVLSEFQLYRVYNLLTPLSFQARLAHVTYVDAVKHDTLASRYAFLGEEPEEAAKRLGGKSFVEKNIQGNDLDPDTRAIFGVFQYFIGNTDFSVTALHNVLLLQKDSILDYVFPVARDFDWSGAVNTRYSFPDYRLPIKNVKQRLMKGDCAPKEVFDKTFALFREKKPAIYALYHDSLSAPMKADRVRETLSYFDEFYQQLDDKRAVDYDIVRACGPS